MNRLIIETNRLILRPLVASDANEVFVWVSDERVTEFMPYSTYSSVEAVKDCKLDGSQTFKAKHYKAHLDSI